MPTNNRSVTLETSLQALVNGIRDRGCAIAVLVPDEIPSGTNLRELESRMLTAGLEYIVEQEQSL